jgi:hypothetical protein
MNRKLLLRVAGTCIVLLVWQIVGMTGVLGPAIAPPAQVSPVWSPTARHSTDTMSR